MLFAGFVLLLLSALAFLSYCDSQEQQRLRRFNRWLYEQRRSPGVADHD